MTMQNGEPEIQGENPLSQDSKTGQEIEDLVVSNEQIYSMLIATITHKVTTYLEEKESRNRSIFIGTSSLILIVLVAIGSFLINELLEVRVQKSVLEYQGNSIAQALFIVEVADLKLEAKAMTEGDGFRNDEAHTIIKKMGVLYKNGVANIPDPKTANDNIDRLLPAFDKATLAFGQASRVDYILNLERAAPLVARQSDESAMVITVSLGDKLLGDARAPESWQEGGRLHEEFKKFRFYSKRAKESGYPELYVIYELLLDYSLEGANVVHLKLLDDLDSLEEADAQNLITVLDQMIGLRRTADQRRQSDIVLEFLQLYRQESAYIATYLDAWEND